MGQLPDTDDLVERMADAYHWASSACTAQSCPGAWYCPRADDLSPEGFRAVLRLLMGPKLESLRSPAIRARLGRSET